MIIYNDRKNKENSKYICDRCKVELTIENKLAIWVETQKNNRVSKKKKWDFCNRCYRLLKRGIEKGGTNDNTNNSNSKE